MKSMIAFRYGSFVIRERPTSIVTANASSWRRAGGGYVQNDFVADVNNNEWQRHIIENRTEPVETEFPNKHHGDK